MCNRCPVEAEFIVAFCAIYSLFLTYSNVCHVLGQIVENLLILIINSIVVLPPDCSNVSMAHHMTKLQSINKFIFLVGMQNMHSRYSKMFSILKAALQVFWQFKTSTKNITLLLWYFIGRTFLVLLLWKLNCSSLLQNIFLMWIM